MSTRQIYLSLLSSVFLFGSTQGLMAMEAPLEGDRETHLSAHPSLSSSEHDDESTESMDWEVPLKGDKVVITEEDKEKFELIIAVQNPLLETNEQLDETQKLLSAPLKAELSLGKYLKLKNPKAEEGANSSVSIGLLENGTKVVIKRNKYSSPSQEEIKTSYDLEQATLELVAPQIARAYFDVPTLPPTVYLPGEKDHFEVRQYFIEGETPEEDEEKDVKKRMELSRELYLHSESFNRPLGFIDFNVIVECFLDDLGCDSDEEISSLSAFLLSLHLEWLQTHKSPQADVGHLRLFDFFIAAADRNNTQHLFIPCESTQNERQKWAYFGIDYAETYYNPRKGIVGTTGSESSESSESEEDFEEIPENAEKWTAPLSAVNKLKELHKNYRDFFKEAEKLAPEIYNDTYFNALKESQEELLNRLVGIEI